MDGSTENKRIRNQSIVIVGNGLRWHYALGTYDHVKNEWLPKFYKILDSVRWFCAVSCVKNTSLYSYNNHEKKMPPAPTFNGANGISWIENTKEMYKELSSIRVYWGYVFASSVSSSLAAVEVSSGEWSVTIHATFVTGCETIAVALETPMS